MTRCYGSSSRFRWDRGASCLVVLAVFLGTLAPTATAQSRPTDSLDIDSLHIKLPLAVEITDLSVQGSPAVGSRFVVQVRYDSRISGSAVLAINLPHNVDPLGHSVRRVDGAPSLEVPLALRVGGQGVATFPLRVTTGGPLMIAAQIRVADAPDGFEPYTWEHLEINSSRGQAVVRNPKREGAFRTVEPTAASSGALTADTPFSASGPPVAAGPVTAQSMALYRFSVSGRAYFNDEAGVPRGVWGAKVRLYLRRAGYSFFPLVSGDTPGVNHVVVGEDGQYSFNFTYNGTFQSTDELVAFVSSSTPTVILRTGAAYTFYGEPYFTESWAVPLSGLGTNISINRDAVVAPGYGAVLRYMTLAQKTVDSAYRGSPPVTTSPRYASNQADIYIEDLDGCGRYRVWWAWFDYNRRLSIDPACTQIQTIPHEYGHWLHESLVGRGTYFDADQPAVTEGFAVFHSFAARGWANSRYGDPTRSYSDNPETAPYDVGSGEDGQTVRFRNFKYAYGGSPAVGAMGSFLWAVYDGPDDRDLETSLYDAGDNDDIDGQPLYVYDAFRLGLPKTASQVRDAVLARTPSTLDPAVSAAYTFMHASLTSVPSTPMRAVQAGSFSGQKLSPTSAQLTWATNTYPYSGAYVNRPTGYNVYRNSSLVATLPNTTTSYAYTNAGGVDGSYRVTAYNAAGESAAAPTARIGVVASIAGPSLIPAGQLNSWTASVTGGSGTTTYKWYQNGAFTGVTSPTYSGFSYVDVDLRVDVTRGTDTASASLYVAVYGDGGCVPEPGEILCVSPAPLQAAAIPEVFALHAPSPNPSRGPVEVRYDLPEAAPVRVAVYDVTGREVALLADGMTGAGYHRASLDPAALSAGVYLVRITAGTDVAVRQLTVVR